MNRSLIRRGSAYALVIDPTAPADPLPRPLNGYYFRSAGYQVKGSTYTKDGITVVYDGCYWTCGGMRIETIEELEKIMLI
jgi:hypothetical protein